MYIQTLEHGLKTETGGQKLKHLVVWLWFLYPNCSSQENINEMLFNIE